ncbi:MAG TPA: alpha/beta fold hydrolase [Candidatus Eisenbacteria bacterium]|jgi:pimeloyl-ACP methyl ester carboxylesterase
MRPAFAAGAAGLIAAAIAAPLAAQAPVALKLTELGRGPTLVFVHGLGGARLEWMPTARKLVGDHHVVMVDLPAHGESPMPDPFSFDACAAALDLVLARQKADSTVVVAHGLGGAIALIEARAHPERMKGLIVIDASLKPPLPVPDQQKRAFLEFMDANFDDFLKRIYAGMARDSAEAVTLHARAALVPQPSMKAYFHALFDLDVSGATRTLKTPLLFVGSSRSWPDTASWATVAKLRGFEDPTLVAARRIADSGAQMYADQPDTLAMVIRQFEARVMARK